jgi:hypothetical protein
MWILNNSKELLESLKSPFFSNLQYQNLWLYNTIRPYLMVN